MAWIDPLNQKPQTAPIAPTAAGTPNPSDLKSIAAQFEALLLGQMLKEMRGSMLDDDKESGFASGPLSDAMYSELSLSLSRAGGIGLGRAMTDAIARQSPSTSPATEAAAVAN